MSLPGQQVVDTREQEVRVLACDLSGRRVEMAASKLWARVIEHEIDHLQGVLIIDHGNVVLPG